MSATLRARLAAVLLGLALALGCAEVVLRVRPDLGAPRLPLTYRHEAIDRLAGGRVYVRFDPDLGWVSSPNVDWELERIHYRNNAEGIRADREYTPRPAPGVRRIAAYGDSFTYCEDVDISFCWARRAEKLYLPDSEVLILGVPGYGPDQAWLRYQQGGAARQPCAVLIGYTVENVNRAINRFRPFYAPTTGIPLPKPRYVLQQGRLTLLPNPARDLHQLEDAAWVEANLGPHDDWYFPHLFTPAPFDWLETSRLTRTALYQIDRQETVRWTPNRARQLYRPGSDSLAVVAGVLGGFAQQVRADGATPILIIFPWRAEVAALRDGQGKTHQPLLDALAASGVPTIDLTDLLADEARETELEKLMSSHYSPRGNDLVARHVAAQLPRLSAATCRWD